MDCSHSLIDGYCRAVQPVGGSQASTVRAQHTGLPPSRMTPASPAEGESIQLAQLLSSRICHDLIGPIGIAAATDDLRDADDRIDAEALSLVAESARTAAARLSFFRFAFGFGQNGNGAATCTSLITLARGALQSNRLRLEWRQKDAAASAADHSLPVTEARLLLCLTLIATEALPRGGTVSIVVSRSTVGLDLLIRAAGASARMPQASFDASMADSCSHLTPRTVVGFYAGRLSAQLNARLGWASKPGESVEIALSVPVRSRRDEKRHHAGA